MSKQNQKTIEISLPDPVMATVLQGILEKNYQINLTEKTTDKVDTQVDLYIIGEGDVKTQDTSILSVSAPLRLGVLLDQINRFFSMQDAQSLKQEIVLDSFVFEPATRVLTHKESGEKLSLTEKEAGMVLYLYQHVGKIIPRQELLENVWQYSAEINTRTLETHIYRLRQKILQVSNTPLIYTEDEGYLLRL